MDSVGQYEVIHGSGFDPVLSILALRRSSKVGWVNFVDLECLFLSYNFATAEISSLVPPWVAKRQRSGSEASVSVSGRDVVWLPGLAYTSMESFHVDYRAPNSKKTDVPAEVEVLSVDMPKMDDRGLLLEKDAGWSQYVGSFEPRLVDTWEKYCGEPILSGFSVLVRRLRL